MALPYTVLDRQRVRFETYAETGSVDLDLTGRTLTLLVGDIVSIACSVTPGASSSTRRTTAEASATVSATDSAMIDRPVAVSSHRIITA